MNYISIDYLKQCSYMVVEKGRGKVYRIGGISVFFEALPDRQRCSEVNQ